MSQYGLLLVSHVPSIAEGVETLIKEVAPDVEIVLAAGTNEGEVGTSFDKVLNAIETHPSDEILAFFDLGSALMNIEMAQEMSDKTVHVYHTALVEGAYNAAALLQVDVNKEEIDRALEPLTIEK
ncbi:dihydroxyacetone kinase phosphoryl donor subunit DhaM [Dolosicoccus paucivorans]|uniref:phosphoenolpyruvate--glycerone phosphotransferase n=1 Tax=Dolosicoccus paucivorans TaxID=84521 RepID=A0A1G8K1R1_9LACT|nr:dihydroxyacetone kinase phosphoryl donor subunit DhaM [Dolosicoccus paucivorans]PMB84775.1 PTS-dependent dihydroxyacetone kinase phosphotransferase subunit DhaM [Dolosicoccus paucivorans]PMC58199.1 PTS-dependent dihydroxyacetone kinase phosphotransferase subunit DhaM [Dolosicoccus paucivorans]SDI37343.1 dihydroxyacetone kinase DhaM subunit [Dolosicoccus paucivorans]